MSDTIDTNKIQWQTSCNVKERSSHLLKSGQWSDCTLLVGPESRPFQAHKLILSMASPVFEGMLQGGEEKQVVTLAETDPEVFTNLLSYIYTEDININSFELAREVYRTADRFKLKQLTHICLTYMAYNITNEHACEAYELGLLFNEQLLVDESLRVIKTYPKEVLASKGFEQAHIDTAIKIFSTEGLQIDSELDLCLAAERYIRAQLNKVNQNNLETRKGVKRDGNENIVEVTNNLEVGEQSVNYQTNGANPAKALLKQIHFLTLTAAQFAQIARSALFTESEAFAILVNILYPATDVPLPSGINSSRVVRYQRPSPPRSTCATLHFTLTIRPDCDFTCSATSPPQLLFGQRCTLIMIPEHESYTNDERNSCYFGFFFRVEIPAQSDWSCMATIVLRLHNKDQSKSLSTSSTKKRKIDSCRPEIGKQRFIKRYEVFQLDDGFLQDGAFTVQLWVDADAL